MAETVIKKVEDQLCCSVCLGTYSDPKLLQCLHEYCQSCLVKLVVRDQQGQGSVTCPTCRQVTPLPAKGVAGLKPAFRINHLLEIVAEHKMAKFKLSTSLEKDFLSSTGSCAPIGTIWCGEHTGKAVELYCQTCKDPICLKCAVKGGKHHSHDYKELASAFEASRTEIGASLEPLEKHLAVIGKALARFEIHSEEISAHQSVIEADICKAFKQLQEILETRKSKLISDLHQIIQEKQSNLAARRESFKTLHAQISECIKNVKETLETSSELEILTTETDLVQQITELTVTYPPDDVVWPITEADVVFTTSPDLITACENHGQVFAPWLLDLSKCHVTFDDVKVQSGVTSTAVFQAVCFNGQPYEEPIDTLDCELVSDVTGTSARGIVERKGQSQYRLSYQPTSDGQHRLHIKVGGQHIRGSPICMVVDEAPSSWHWLRR